MSRLGTGETHEVILALDPNIEGEATAAYLSRLLGPLELTVTRLASGLPVGGDLDYADEMTLGRALLGRRTMRGRRHVDYPCPRPAAGAADEPAPTAAAPARGPRPGAARRDHRRIPPHDHPGTAADRLGPGADPDRAVVRAVGAVRGGRLAHLLGSGGAGEPRRAHAAPHHHVSAGLHLLGPVDGVPAAPGRGDGAEPSAAAAGHRRDRRRSEEHTSELQSRGHLVCRLLLENKK